MLPSDTYIAIPVSCAPGEAYFAIPRDFVPVAVQLVFPFGEVIPHVPNVEATQLAIADGPFDPAVPGQVYPDLVYHPRPGFQIDDRQPRVELIGAQIGRIRKPASSFPYGVRLIGFGSTGAAEG